MATEYLRCWDCVWFNQSTDRCQFNPPQAVVVAGVVTWQQPKVDAEEDWCSHHQLDGE